jgi:hypothetical protein
MTVKGSFGEELRDTTLDTRCKWEASKVEQFHKHIRYLLADGRLARELRGAAKQGRFKMEICDDIPGEAVTLTNLGLWFIILTLGLGIPFVFASTQHRLGVFFDLSGVEGERLSNYLKDGGLKCTLRKTYGFDHWTLTARWGGEDQ